MREEHAASTARLQAMTPRQRLRHRAGMVLFVGVGAVLLQWFKSLW